MFQLEMNGPLVFTVLAGQLEPHAAPVVVLDGPEGEPVAGVRVRFRVVEGPMTVGEFQTPETILVTDRDGSASVPARMNAVGNGLLAVELPDGGGPPQMFVLRTEGMVHQVSLYSEPSFLSEQGEMKITIAAVDHRRHPVTGAVLVVEGHVSPDTSERGSVKEIGGGMYEGVIRTHAAGEWVLLAQDRATHVSGHRTVQMVPGAPAAIEVVGKPDPRATPPYGSVIVRARLVDAHGNSLNPLRLAGEMDRTPLESWIVGQEAWFQVRSAGHGAREVRLVDGESGLAISTDIPFAAAWLANPGVVEPGQSWETVLHVAPAAGGPLRTATIRVTFDAERAAFVAVRPVAETGSRLTLATKVEGNLLTIDVRSDRGIDGSDWPDGIPVSGIEWSCLGVGTTCFTVEGAMSPEFDGWTLCMEQKYKQINIQCICVNVIYRTWVNADRRTGRLMAMSAVGIISSNLYECCPVLRYRWNSCALQGWQWVQIMRLWGGQVPTSEADVEALLEADGFCKQDDCINIYVLPMAVPGVVGMTSRVNGAMMIDPASPLTAPTVAAHEIGHALGLEHHPDPINLMYELAANGDNLTSEQCRTIWDNLGRFPCSY